MAIAEQLMGVVGGVNTDGFFDQSGVIRAAQQVCSNMDKVSPL